MSSEFSSILSHFKLREKDCEKTVTDNHLDEISLNCCACGDWRFLASLLELEDSVASDIDCKTCDEKGKKRDFFREWRQRKGHEATYKKLILALLKRKQQQDAEKVCKLLYEAPQASMTAPPVQSM